MLGGGRKPAPAPQLTQTAQQPPPRNLVLTFLASSILLSKTYVMQFLTTSNRRALLASTMPLRSVKVPVGRKY